MEITVNQTPKCHILKLVGRWDAFSTTSFEQICQQLVAGGMRQVVIEASGVDYVSSFGLRSLLNLGKMLEPLGCVHICALQPQVRKVFVGSGFNSIFSEYPDLEKASASFKTHDISLSTQPPEFGCNGNRTRSPKNRGQL